MEVLRNACTGDRVSGGAQGLEHTVAPSQQGLAAHTYSWRPWGSGAVTGGGKQGPQHRGLVISRHTSSRPERGRSWGIGTGGTWEMPALPGGFWGPQTRDGGHRWAATGQQRRGERQWGGLRGMKRGHRGTNVRVAGQAEAADGTGPSQGCRQDRTRAEADVGQDRAEGAAEAGAREGERAPGSHRRP